MEATENSRLTSLMMLDASRVRGEAGPLVGVHRADPDERSDRVDDARDVGELAAAHRLRGLQVVLLLAGRRGLLQRIGRRGTP